MLTVQGAQVSKSTFDEFAQINSSVKSPEAAATLILSAQINQMSANLVTLAAKMEQLSARLDQLRIEQPTR